MCLINSNLAVVATKTDPKAVPPHEGISIICVEDDTPGFLKGPKHKKMGLHSQDTAQLFFEDCRVPVGNLLGEERKGFLYLMKNLQEERLVITIMTQSMAEVCWI